MRNFEIRHSAFLKMLASADFLELLQYSKDVSLSLEYRAKIEETILTAQKLANGAVS